VELSAAEQYGEMLMPHVKKSPVEMNEPVCFDIERKVKERCAGSEAVNLPPGTPRLLMTDVDMASIIETWVAEG
jgi:hypothetical protein